MAEEKAPVPPKEAPKSLADTVRSYVDFINYLQSPEGTKKLYENAMAVTEPLRLALQEAESVCVKIATLEKNALTPVELGDPRVFAKYSPDGKRLIAIKAQLPLSEALGELYEVKGKVAITAAGYHTCNRYAAISLVGPLTLGVADEQGRLVERPNPWMEREPKTGFVREVWVRRVAFGLAPTGSLAIVDRTIHFNIRAYLLQALVAKMKENPSCARWMPEDERDEWQKHINAKRKAENKTEGRDWFLLMEPPVGLWVDLSHNEILECLNEHTQRLRFAERHAVSICERKALQGHPAIARTLVNATGPAKQRRAVVTVYGFRHDMDRKAVERLAFAIAEGHEEKIHSEAAALGMGTVERTARTEEAEPEDVQAAEPEGDETGTPKEVAETAAAPAQVVEIDQHAAERDKLLADIKIARSALRNEPEFTRLTKEAGITGMLSHSSVEALRMLLKKISRAVDQAAAKTDGK